MSPRNWFIAMGILLTLVPAACAPAQAGGVSPSAEIHLSRQKVDGGGRVEFWITGFQPGEAVAVRVQSPSAQPLELGDVKADSQSAVVGGVITADNAAPGSHRLEWLGRQSGRIAEAQIVVEEPGGTIQASETTDEQPTKVLSDHPWRLDASMDDCATCRRLHERP